MPKMSRTSKAVALALVILTISVIMGVVVYVVTSHRALTATGLMRLPKNLIPHSYKIFMQIDFYTRNTGVANVTYNQTMLFSGNSTVNFQCVQSTKTIFMKSKDLQVFDPSVVMNTKSKKRIGVSQLKLHEGLSDLLEIQLTETLEEGEDYSLFLAFKGVFTGGLNGLFMSMYNEGNSTHEGGTIRFVASTSMEPTDARTVFPCFDEPDMKAVFHVTIIHRRGTIALSNGEMSESNIIDDEWQYTSFHPTPKMSTYLLALSVSEFTSIPSPHERVDIKIFARPEATAAGHTQYAANFTGKILKFYESYLGIDYPQKKLDQIAVPDYAFAAMENWGLVTYEESALFYEEGVTSLHEKEFVISVIAHELAHQWFGNLVTMKWWNDIWLNEGFASYMTNLAVDHVAPTFQLKDIQYMSNLHVLLEKESKDSSHPLSPPEEQIQMTSEINKLFDGITYNKGAFVLRMLADTVGENVFHKGIKMYLSHFSYENTDQSDLMNYIQKAVDDDNGHTNVSMMMTTWTSQTGFPLVTINTTSGEIYQRQFWINDSSQSNRVWHIPVRIMSDTSESSFFLTTGSTERKNELISKNGEWVLANINCTGYYRVNYNPENWERLVTQLETNPDRIPVLNRWQLLEDAFTLARVKLVDVTLPLNLTRFLRNEMEYLPWESTMRNLRYFLLMFDRTEVFGPMQVYLREQVRFMYNFFSNYTHNSQVPEDHSLQHGQILTVNVACSFGLPECIAMATKMFNNWMNNDNNQIHPNLRSAIYCRAVASGGKKEWDFVWEKYQNCNNTSEKDSLSDALACTKKIWLLNRYLNYTLNPEEKNLTGGTWTISSIVRNVVGHALAWNFIRANWAYLKERDAALMLIEEVASRFSSQFELEELRRFARDYDLGAATESVNMAIEQTKINIEWVSKNKDIVLEWFERETAS